MAIEKHMLQTHSVFEKAGEVLEGVVKLKERIAELEAENAELKRKNEGLLYALADVETDFEMSTRWRSFKDEPPEHHQWIEAYFRKDSITERCPGIEIRRWDDGMKYDVFEQELYVGWKPLPKAPEASDK